jgi:two-component system, OmpR family, response regulator
MKDDPKYKVLIVDDDAFQLEVVSRTLRSYGFEVVTAESPIGVSNSVRSFKPDVVLVDVNIPALSGDKVIETVRRLSQGSARFVLYSACDEAELRALARQSKADGWISKSETGQALVARIRSFLPPASGRRGA